jgi:pimeloyl-ACP methyl ester carboxylesterase
MITTSFGKTFVRISGQKNAPSLVLLPGDTENSLSWIPQIESLSKHYKVIAIDHIYDNGLSVYSKHLENSNDIIKWLNELFDKLGLGKKINLVGFSYGGWQASIYAISHPDKLNKMILISAPTIIRPRIRYLIPSIITHIFPTKYFIKNLVRWERKCLYKKGQWGKAIVNEMIEDLIIASKCFKKRGFINPFVLKKSDWKRIKKIPTLYLVGQEEIIYSSQKAIKRFKKIASWIQTEIIPNASHDITHSQSEIVNKKILNFLK